MKRMHISGKYGYCPVDNPLLGYGDEDALHASFVQAVLRPVVYVLVSLVALLAIPACLWTPAPAHAAQPTVLEPLPDAVAQAPAVTAAADAIREAAAQVTPDMNPPAAEVSAAFVADALATAGITDWREPERMSPAGTQWAKLNQRLNANGPSPALKAAFVAFFQRVKGADAQ